MDGEEDVPGTTIGVMGLLMPLPGMQSADVRFTPLSIFLILTYNPQLTAESTARARVEGRTMRERRLLVLLSSAFNTKKKRSTAAVKRGAVFSKKRDPSLNVGWGRPLLNQRPHTPFPDLPTFLASATSRCTRPSLLLIHQCDSSVASFPAVPLSFPLFQ